MSFENHQQVQLCCSVVRAQRGCVGKQWILHVTGHLNAEDLGCLLLQVFYTTCHKTRTYVITTYYYTLSWVQRQRHVRHSAETFQEDL